MWQPIFMTLTAAAFAWQVHGWVAGVFVAVLVQVIIPFFTAKLFWSNMEKADADPLEVVKKATKLRWIIWGGVMILIAISGANVRSV